MRICVSFLRKVAPAFLLALAAFIAPGQTLPPQSPPPQSPPVTPPVQKEGGNPFVTGPADHTPVALTKESKKQILDEITNIVEHRAFIPGVDLGRWPEYIAKQSDALEKAQSDAEFTKAVNAALFDFGVSHIHLLSPRSEQARERTSTVGVGISVQADKTGLTITQVYPQSPAEQMGLHTGDKILTIDGKVPNSSEALAGDENTNVAIKLVPKDGKERELTVKRARYSTVRQPTLTFVGDVAVLKLWSFTKGYDRELLEDLFKKASTYKYLLLDLRSNGGGDTGNLQHLLSLLMPPGVVIGTFVSRRLVENFNRDHPGTNETDPIAIAKDSNDRYKTEIAGVAPYPGKLAVLVNRGSASASEIVAWALRENLDTPIVGSKTAGAVLASVFRRLDNGYEIQYPVSDYVTKNGVRLEKNPMLPDIIVSGPAKPGADPAIDQAIAKLKG